MAQKKYHLNPETGNINICHATERPCKFGESNHFLNIRNAERFYESLMNDKLGKPKRNLSPVIVDINKIPPINQWDLQNIQDGVKNDGINIIKINIKLAVEEYLSTSYDNWCDTIVNCVNQNEIEWSTIANWSLNDDLLSDDYIVAPNNFTTKLIEAYYSSNNAVDPDGVLEHVRGKGFDTSGLKPLDALKKMLREENGKYVLSVEKTKNISSKILSISDFTLSSNHIRNIDAAEPSPVNNTKSVLGVVVLNDNGYHLVDGHHRVKWCMENNIKKGNFFVLS